MKKYTRPKKLKELRTFQGLAGFYRKFIDKFSDIVEPLNRLTRKNTKFIWNQECQKAFDIIIKYLISPSILAYPDFDKTFHLKTDASDIGLGAVLSQIGDDNIERPIYYSSKSLNQAERKRTFGNRICGRKF